MNYKILIIGILIGGLSIIGASIYVGIQKRDVEVEDNAYNAGLKYDETMKMKERLGWTIELPKTMTSGAAQLRMRLLDGKGAGIEGATVELFINKRGEHTVYKSKCVGSGNGLYTAAVRLNTPGCWEVRAEAARSGDTLRFDNTIYVQ